MRIGLDLRCLPNDGTEGAGIAHASRMLCSELIKEQGIEWIPYVPKNAIWHPGLRYELKDVSRRSLLRSMKSRPCDLLFVPSGAISLHLPVKAVPWVHDLMIFDHPDWFPQSWFKRQLTTCLYLRGLKSAPSILSVSEFTKQAISRLSGLPLDRIMVTGEGGDDILAAIEEKDLPTSKIAARAFCRKRLGLPKPFILSLGTVEPRKNLALLIRAWRKVKDIDLVVAGRNGWKFSDIERLVADLRPDERPRLHRLSDINDHDRRQLLLAAQAIAIPSLEEGFGLTALEGLQAGTPVMASDRGALPEVVGRAGILLEPDDEEAWRRAIELVAHPESHKFLNSAGLGAMVKALRSSQNMEAVMAIEDHVGIHERLAQARLYSWGNVSEKVLETLKRTF